MVDGPELDCPGGYVVGRTEAIEYRVPVSPLPSGFAVIVPRRSGVGTQLPLDEEHVRLYRAARAMFDVLVEVDGALAEAAPELGAKVRAVLAMVAGT